MTTAALAVALVVAVVVQAVTGSGFGVIAGLVMRGVHDACMRPLTLGVSLLGGLLLFARAAL